jgi:uncharacterized membrane protein
MLNKIIISSVIFSLLDSFYLSIFKEKFIKMVNNIQKENFKINFFGFFMTYFFLILGLFFLFKNNINYKDAFLFGIIIYGVYEMTNLAIFNKWSYLLSFIDILWGGILFSTTIFLTNILFTII